MSYQRQANGYSSSLWVMTERRLVLMGDESSLHQQADALTTRLALKYRVCEKRRSYVGTVCSENYC